MKSQWLLARQRLGFATLEAIASRLNSAVFLYKFFGPTSLQHKETLGLV